MKSIYILLTVFTLAACNSFNRKILDDAKYASGYIYGTNERIKPKVFKYDDYTFITGFPDNGGTASFGLYYRKKEIHYEEATDGVYDTVLKVNLNNDGIPDFLLSYTFEDGASLFGLLSNAKTSFANKRLLDDWSDAHCYAGADTLQFIIPLQIKDLNNDGKDDIIANLVNIKSDTFAIPCTDTVFAQAVR